MTDPAIAAVLWTLAIMGAIGLLGLALVKWRRSRSDPAALTYNWRKDHVNQESEKGTS